MELNKQIKKHRSAMELSQEQLAEKLYVTRQTISNWETGKNYPDIHSLILMSSLFGVSLDKLIKGDLEMMEEKIKTEDIKKFNFYGGIFTILLIICIVFVAPLIYFFEIYGAIAAALIFAVTFVFSLKVEKFKKENDIQTYREIVSFSKGERLDEITKNREIGKRPYQKFLSALACGAVTFVLSILLIKLLSYIK